MSWQGVAITAPLGVGVIALSAQASSDVLTWLGIAVAAVAVGGAWTYLMHRTIFRDRALEPVSVPWVVATGVIVGALYVGTAIVLGLLLGVLSVDTAVTQFPPLFIVVVTWGLLLTLILDSQWRFRVQREELIQEAVQQQLASAQEWEVLNDLREKVLAEVDVRMRSSSEPLLNRIDELIASGQTDAAPLANELRSVAESIVRPLSHELADRARRTHRPPGLFQALANIVRYQPFRPFAVSIVYAITATPREIQNNGLAVGVGLLMATVAFIFAIMTGLNAAMRRWPVHHAVIFLFGLVVIQAPTLILNPLREEITGESVSASNLLVTMIFGTVIVIAVSAYGSWNRTRVQVISDFRQEVDLERIATLARGQALARATRDAALVLHGSVQTQLHASALTIEDAARTGNLVEVNRALMRARAVLEDPGLQRAGNSRECLEDLLAAQVTQWSGLVTVTLTLDRYLASMQGEMATFVAAVVEEGIANAFHHGSAKLVEVVVTKEENDVVITVTDNGTGLAGGSPGLGSRLFTSGGGPWHLESVDQHTRLEVRIPRGS